MCTGNKPLVSIVMPVYNAEPFLKDALDSCLMQSHRPIEIICVENNSKDGSLSILKRYCTKYPGIMRLSYETTAGAPAARNKGIEDSHGEFIYFLDSDDALAPDAVELLLDHMEDGFDATCGSEDYYRSRLDGERDGERMRTKNTDYQVADILYNHPNTGAVLLRRSSIKDVRWDLSLKSQQELVFWVQLCLQNNAKFKYVPEKVCKIRIHNSPGRISNQGKKKRADNKYLAILKIEKLLESSPFGSEIIEIAFNDFKLQHSFDSINARNFKISQLTSARVKRNLIPSSKNFRRISKEGVTYLSNHYLGFVFHYLGYKFLGRFYSSLNKNRYCP